MKSTTVRGTPYTHYGPTGGGVNRDEGYRQGGGNADNTVQNQYREGGINTQANSRGTPAQYAHGNPDESSRTVSSDKYGKVQSNQQGNANDPSNTGAGVLLGSTGEDHSPPGASALDSPVPSSAPVFDPGYMVSENRAHLGSGNEKAATGGLLAAGGVMSRGMVQKSTPGGPEDELTTDDTLPAVGPAR